MSKRVGGPGTLKKEATKESERVQLSLVLHLPTLSLFIVKSSGQENQKMGKSNIIYTTAVNMACHQHQQTQGAATAVVDPILPFHLTNKQMEF